MIPRLLKLAKPTIGIPETSQTAAEGRSMHLATAQTPEEFRICVIDVEQELDVEGQQ